MVKENAKPPKKQTKFKFTAWNTALEIRVITRETSSCSVSSSLLTQRKSVYLCTYLCLYTYTYMYVLHGNQSV